MPRESGLAGWGGSGALLALDAVASSDAVYVLPAAFDGFDDLGFTDAEVQRGEDVLFFTVEGALPGLGASFQAPQCLPLVVPAGHGRKLCHRSCNKTTCNGDTRSATLYAT